MSRSAVPSHETQISGEKQAVKLRVIVLFAALLILPIAILSRTASAAKTKKVQKPRVTQPSGSSQPTTVASKNKQSPATRGTTIPPVPDRIQAGAAANISRIPPVKLGKGRKLSATGLADLQAKLNDLRPGDVLDVEPGEYVGGVIIPPTAKGVPGNGIVVRSRVANGAVFSGCGGQTQAGGSPCISVQSEFVTVQGFGFGKTSDTAVEMEGAHNRLFENTFTGSGSGANGGCCAIVLSPHDWRNKDWNDPNPTLLQRFNRIDKNTFTNIRNAAYSQGHGVVGTVFSHNTIVGPHGIDGDWETEAIKIGGDFANEPTNTTIEFNTILNWRGAPYTIGIKGSDVTTAYNFIEVGDISLRIANTNRVVGNVLLDGSLIASGTGHTITGNYIRNSTGPAGYGPIMATTNLTISNSAGNFDGVEKPFYVARFASSTVTNNVLVNSGSAFAVYFVINSSTPSPSEVVFKGNTFVRTTAGPLVSGVDDVSNGNQLIGNTFVCMSACVGQQMPVNGNGNKLLSTIGADVVSNPNPMVPFIQDLVR
jgi:hypothetical protein